MVHPPGGKTAPHSIKAPRFEPLGQIVSPFCCNSFLSLLRVYALQACPSVGGGTAERPCAGQKFSAQEFLSIQPLRKAARQCTPESGCLLVSINRGSIQLSKVTGLSVLNESTEA